LERSQAELLGVLAFIVAASVDAVQRKGDRPDAVRLTHVSQIAGAIGLDMRTWFVPGAENCFGRINRAGILAAIDEAKGTHAPALGKLKKNELAQRAETLVADSGWLPEPLRPSPPKCRSAATPGCSSQPGFSRSDSAAPAHPRLATRYWG
jgi:ParB family chromosome partitioning protein